MTGSIIRLANETGKTKKRTVTYMVTVKFSSGEIKNTQTHMKAFYCGTLQLLTLRSSY